MSRARQVLQGLNRRWIMEQHPTEITGFAAFLVAYWPRVGARGVVELGVRHGGTSALWHQLLPDATVVGVDRVGHDSYQEPEFSARARDMEREFSRYTFVRGNSADPETVRQVRLALRDEPIGFLFIDADHSYEAVKRDYATYLPLVAPGGVIAFHDIVDGPRTGGGVHRFFSELITSTERWRTDRTSRRRWCVEADWGGIGAVIV